MLYPANLNQNQKQNQNQNKVLALIDDQIKFTISLSEIPSTGQFRNATPEAQSLALISLLKIEYTSLTYAVRALTRVSRALRCTIFELRPILTTESYPALRISGSQQEIEDTLWEYARTAIDSMASANESKREIRIKVLAAQAKQDAQIPETLAPYEVPRQSSQDKAKVALQQNKKAAKLALSQIISCSLSGAAEGSPKFNLKPALLAFCKEVVKGENLATCPTVLRAKASAALRSSGAAEESSKTEELRKALESFAAILDSSFDPFLGKAQELVSLELDLMPAEGSKPEGSKPKTLAEILAARKFKQHQPE